MKKWLACLGLLVVLAQPAAAFRPAGWVYMDYPWAYDSASGDWYWFNTPNTQWVVRMSNGQWAKLQNSALATGWVFFNWAYAYAPSNGAWHWVNEPDTQWVVNMRTTQWSRFGVQQVYLVIDLAAGPAAASYPVSYLSSVPAGGWTDIYKTTKLVLRLIPATTGAFTMGSPVGELGRDAAETQHQVTLTKNFYIGVFEVTQKQWERVVGMWPSYFSNTTYRESRPVEQVSYDNIRGTVAGTNWPANNNVDANSFMGRLRARTGQAFDLPTESQWEYAGRAGTTRALNSGYNLTNMYDDARMAEVGRYSENGGSEATSTGNTSVATAKVGSYLANAWGLYDIHGNVGEWCLDWTGTYPGTVSDPKGAVSARSRVFRGGSWDYYALYCRSASRGYSGPAFLFDDLGFRIARTLP